MDLYFDYLYTFYDKCYISKSSSDISNCSTNIEVLTKNEKYNDINNCKSNSSKISTILANE